MNPYKLVFDSAKVLEADGWGSFEAIELAAYFWQRVEFGDGCWRWTGTQGPRGYGSATWRYQRYRSNRLALMVAVGAAPEGEDVALHDCDNRICVRTGEGHLRWGTQSGNMQDMVSRGRHWMHDDPIRARAVAVGNLQAVKR